MKNDHRTIFTQSIVDNQTLDASTARLIQYFYSSPPCVGFLEGQGSKSATHESITLETYIHRTMMTFLVLLTLEAASQLQQYYSAPFYHELSKLSPVKMKDLKKTRVEHRMWSAIRRQRI